MLRNWVWRFQRITSSELRLLVEAQLTLLFCQLRKWWRPVGELISVESRQEHRVVPRSELQHAAQVAWAITRAARYGVFRPKCLVRSLALQKMLENRGLCGSELRIGVRLQNGVFSAHAWVELSGRVVGDSPQTVQQFTPTTDLRLVQL
ncbi:MAG: lasso peptide biosynthesis B2 protein [Longimicrobiales bacterium]